MTERSNCVFKARLAEQIKRHDDVIAALRQIALMGLDLSVEERRMLSAAYQHKSASLRRALTLCKPRAASAQADDAHMEPGNHDDIRSIRASSSYTATIKAELRKLCDEVVALCEDCLTPNAKTPQTKVFYCTMAADYHRYASEFEKFEARKMAAGLAKRAYAAGLAIAEHSLDTTDPVRLGLTLNFSVLYVENLDSLDAGTQLLQKGYTAAIGDLARLSDPEKNAVLPILSVMRENTSAWQTAALAAPKA